MPITLKAARVNQNLTQAEAAKALKISLASLQNYEAGRRYPNVEIIKRIENVYGVEYKDIIFCGELLLKSNSPHREQIPIPTTDY